MCSVGENGEYIHIMYSDNSSGVPMYNVPEESTKYFGYYKDNKSEDSNNHNDYK